MRSYYASFDAFPTSKGASTHIGHSLQALSEIADKVDVYCLQGLYFYLHVFNKHFSQGLEETYGKVSRKVL